MQFGVMQFGVMRVEGVRVEGCGVVQGRDAGGVDDDGGRAARDDSPVEGRSQDSNWG